MLIVIPSSLVRLFGGNGGSLRCPVSPSPQALQTLARGDSPFCWRTCNPCAHTPEEKQSLAERAISRQCDADSPLEKDLLVPTRAEPTGPHWSLTGTRMSQSCSDIMNPSLSPTIIQGIEKFCLSCKHSRFFSSKNKEMCRRPVVPRGPQMCESVRIRKVL